MSVRFLGACCLAVLGFTTNVVAQTNVDGQLAGRAAVGAKVELVQKETGYRVSKKVASDGSFSFVAVPPGAYSVTETLSSGETQERAATVSVGGTANIDFTEIKLQAVVVMGSRRSTVDTATPESSFDVSADSLSKIPVGRDISDVALLAPGAVLGTTTFGGGTLASFSGSTVAENQYYLNGFNISDLRYRLDPADIPFDFFDSFQIKTGGYSAEFGRSTGGSINTVSKRGDNTWKAGAQAVFRPGYMDSPKTVRNANGDAIYDYSHDKIKASEETLYVSGPLIKDRLFVFGLVNFSSTSTSRVYQSTDFDQDFVKGTAYYDQKNTNPFYAGKIDWQVVDGHSIEVTGLYTPNQVNRNSFIYDLPIASITANTGKIEFNDAIYAQIYRYTGHVTDELTVSSLYGLLKRNSNTVPSGSDCPQVIDGRSVISVQLGCYVGASADLNHDKRKAYRFDVDYAPSFLTSAFFGRHAFKFGIDRENNSSYSNFSLAGGAQYKISTAAAGDPIGGSGVIAPAAGDYYEQIVYTEAGTVKEQLTGFYFQDTVSWGDRVNVVLGLRRDQFKEFNKNDESLLDLTSPLAPRLGITVDPTGQGRSKFFANVGRYYLPVSTQLTLRNGLGVLFTNDVYSLNGFSADQYSRPQPNGASVGGVVTQNGAVLPPSSLIAPGIKPTYSDEISLGYQSMIDGLFPKGVTSAGVRLVWRNLGRAIEDSSYLPGLNAVLGSGAYPNVVNQACADGSSRFVCPENDDGSIGFLIGNPGMGAVVQTPINALGDYDAAGTAGYKPVFVDAQSSGYPKPSRRYIGLELVGEHSEKNYSIYASYTLSQSKGNYEGPVDSNTGQAEMSITTNFDYPGLTTNAYGYLPSDRRHNFKFQGHYDVIGDLRMGATFMALSGRPISSFATNPVDPFSAAYGDASYYDHNGNPVSRGAAGRTPWVTQLDLSLTYTPQWLLSGLSGTLEVFNVLAKTSSYQAVDREADSGALNPNYKLPYQVQTPRFFRLTTRYEFNARDYQK